MPSSLPPGETSIPVALTLEPPRPQGLQTVDGGIRLLSLNFVWKISYATESVHDPYAPGFMHDPRHEIGGEETVETMKLPRSNAYRLVRSLEKILDSRDPYHDNNQAIFQYVGDLGRSFSAPVYRAHNQVRNFGKPGRLPIRPNSIYSIIKDWQSPVHRAFMSLSNPERSLIIEERRWWVANTRDLAKLGGHVTATAFLDGARSHSA